MVVERPHDLHDILAEYPHLVQTVKVDGTFEADKALLTKIEDHPFTHGAVCPFECFWFIEKLPNLRHLLLWGSSAFGFLYMEEFQYAREMARIFHKASLQTQPQDRMLRYYHSIYGETERPIVAVKLGLDSSKCLPPSPRMVLGDFGVVLIIPSLQELQFYGVIFTREGPKLPIQYQSRSRLKRLHLIDSYIDTQALDNILSFPRTLRELTIFHCIPNGMIHPRPGQEDAKTMDNVYNAIRRQSASLKMLKIGWWPYDRGIRAG